MQSTIKTPKKQLWKNKNIHKNSGKKTLKGSYEKNPEKTGVFIL